MAIYLVALIMFLVVLLFIYIATKFKKYKAKMQRVFIGIKKGAFYNNTIRSITISYLETAIQMHTKIKILPASFAIGELAPVLGILMYLLSYPIICFNWLANNR